MNEHEQAVTQVVAQPSLMRDLMIPIAIVLAGASIGLGLYLGGSPAAEGVAAQPYAAAEPAEPADTTDQVRPVDENDHIKGDINADIMIVEYSDFDCPFCSRFHASMDQIVQNNEDVAWVYRHFPLEQLHPQARAVSVASECVAELGGNDAFWVFTDRYFEERGAGNGAAHGQLIAELAVEAGVDNAAFAACFESGEANVLVQEDIDNAIATGGRGTPWSIVIGPSGSTYPINGAQPAATIDQLLEVIRSEG